MTHLAPDPAVTSTSPSVAVNVESYLARYLRLLPDDAHRWSILAMLRRLEPTAAGELLAYLRQLDVSAAADPRFRETYLFAPRHWSARALQARAQRWADPALRHLVGATASETAAAMPFFREPCGLSDMWAIRIDGDARTTLNTGGSTVAVAPIGAGDLVIDGTPVVAGSTAVVSAQRHVSIQPAIDGENCMAVVVASRALLDTTPSDEWLTTRPIEEVTPSAGATAATRRPKYRRGPRSNSVGPRLAPVPSPSAPSPVTATSAGQSPPR